MSDYASRLPSGAASQLDPSPRSDHGWLSTWHRFSLNDYFEPDNVSFGRPAAGVR